MKLRELFTLTEMPEGIPELKEGFRYIRFEIEDLINAGANVTDIGGINKIDTGSELFYWIEDNSEIVLAINLVKSPDAVTVKVTGKKYEGKPPYATDLYLAVLNDQPSPIKFMGDSQLTAKALKLWKRLLNMGYNVSVYDNSSKMITKMTSEDELSQFFKKNDRSYRQYQYILGK